MSESFLTAQEARDMQQNVQQGILDDFLDLLEEMIEETAGNTCKQFIFVDRPLMNEGTFQELLDILDDAEYDVETFQDKKIKIVWALDESEEGGEEEGGEDEGFGEEEEPEGGEGHEGETP